MGIYPPCPFEGRPRGRIGKLVWSLLFCARVASYDPNMQHLPAPFDAIRARHSAVYVIVSPPRCGSTAFARVFWEHPSVRYYSHEPFEVTYYRKEGLAEVAAKLAAPLDLAAINPATEGPRGDRGAVGEAHTGGSDQATCTESLLRRHRRG